MDMVTIPPGADETIGVLVEQAEQYRRLEKLAELQHELVEQDRTEELLELLGKRALVLDQIGRLDQRILPTRQNWAAVSAGWPADRRARAEGLMAEIRSMLERITTADRNDAIVLQQRKLNLGVQIGAAATGRSAVRSYAAAAYGRAAGPGAADTGVRG